MRRICCFCEKWESGGIESFIHSTLGQCEFAEDVRIDIVAAEQKESVFTHPLRQRGVHFYELSGNTRSVLQNYALFRELIREQQYDVIHFHLYQGMAMYYVRIAKRMGVPVRIVHSHNTDLRRSMTRPLKLGIHRMARTLLSGCATELWACSQDAAKFLFSPETLRRRPCRIVPNGIDVERFRFDPAERERVRAALGVENAIVIGNVGRLCYQKNQTFLLDVLHALRKDGEDYRLLLIGNGDEEAHLRAKAAELGISDAVVFYGVSHDVERLLWAMDVFALPSLFEGLGIVAVEAQAASLPTVCSEHIPQEAYLTPLIRKASLDAGAEGWANEIRKLTADRRCPAAVGAAVEEMRLRENGNRMVWEAGFDVQDVARFIQKSYCEVSL